MTRRMRWPSRLSRDGVFRGFALRSCTRLAGTALLLCLLVPGASTAQTADRARFVAESSFLLPGEASPRGPDQPTAVAVGPSGSVHIADQNGGVVVFDSAGRYSRRYGGAWNGKPVAVAVDSAGVAYVLDGDNKRIWVAHPDSQVVRTVGTQGGKAGQLNNPVDVALGEQGFLYVLDRGHSAVQVYSLDGTYLRSVVLPGNLGNPQALTVARDGHFFVSYKGGPSSVVSFSPFPRFGWVSAAAEEPGRSQPLSAPRANKAVGIAVSTGGTLVLADGNSGRLTAASVRPGEPEGEGRFLYGGTGSGRGSFQQIADIALAPPDEIVILDRKLRKVERVRLPAEADRDPLPAYRFPLRVSRVRTGLPGRIFALGRSTDGTPFFVHQQSQGQLRLTGLERVQESTAYGTRFARYRENPDLLERTVGLFDVNKVGDVAVGDTLAVVTDANANRLLAVDLRDGSRIGTFGGNYQDERRLQNPYGAVILPDGRVAVCDRGNNRVAVFGPDLTTLSGVVRMNNPHGAALAGGDTIYAWDKNGRSVVRIALSDSTVELVAPELAPRPVAGMAVDDGGNLFSLNAQTGRVTVAQPALEGALLQIGRAGRLDNPRRIVVDGAGNVYALDKQPGRSVVFRWDVLVPPLGAPEVTYETDGARLRWQPGPTHLIRRYRIEASHRSGGGFQQVARADSAAARLAARDLGDPPPVHLRVRPALVTGGTGPASEAVSLHHLAASSARDRGEDEEAVAAARRALRAIDEGDVAAAKGVEKALLWTAFRSARELERHDRAVALGQRLRSFVSEGRRVEYHLAMADSRLRVGAPREAGRELLRALEADPGRDVVTDSAVRAASFRVARELGVGAADDTAGRGLEYLETYRAALPPRADSLRRVYADSLAAYRTRTLFGEGFEHWSNAQYPQVVQFFEGYLKDPDLTLDQRVVCREFIAAAYYAAGRRETARELFEEILILRPNFDLQEERKRLSRLYGVSLYGGDQMRRFFRELVPGGGGAPGDSAAPGEGGTPADSATASAREVFGA